MPRLRIAIVPQGDRLVTIPVGDFWKPVYVPSLPKTTAYEDYRSYTPRWEQIDVKEFVLWAVLDDSVHYGKYTNNESVQYAIYTERKNTLYDNSTNKYIQTYQQAWTENSYQYLKPTDYATLAIRYVLFRDNDYYGAYGTSLEVEHIVKRQVALGMPKSDWHVVSFYTDGTTKHQTVSLVDTPRFEWSK